MTRRPARIPAAGFGVVDLGPQPTTDDGPARWTLHAKVVDVGKHPDGRRQVTMTFDRRRDARDELARIRHETAKAHLCGAVG